MSVHVETAPAPALLFVRSQGDLNLALKQVNGLLAFRRDRRDDRDYDKILAVCFRRDLDGKLPPLRPSKEETGSPDPSLSICESVSLAGIWTVSWIRGRALSTAHGRREQRKVILQVFLNLLSEQDWLGSVYPVFAREESPEAVAIEMRRLEERHSQLTGLFRFRQDYSRGVYCEATCASECAMGTVGRSRD